MNRRREQVRRGLLADYATHPDKLAVLPLREAVLLPGAVLPINIGRARSARLAEWAAEHVSLEVGVVSQRDPSVEDPGFNDLWAIGTVAQVMKTVRVGPTNWAMVLRGVSRFHLRNVVAEEPFLQARVERIVESELALDENDVARLCELGKLALETDRAEPGSDVQLANAKSGGEAADIIAGGIGGADREDRLEILAAVDSVERVRLALRILERRRTLPPPGETA